MLSATGRNMMLQQIKESIADAQLVLVGIGTEFEVDFEKMKEDPFYIPLMDQAMQEENAEQLLQYLRFHYIRKHPEQSRIQAYQNLARLLEGKNYFVVSLCKDDLIFASGLNPERIVTPCGGFRSLQCTGECVTDQEPLVSDEQVLDALIQSIQKPLFSIYFICKDIVFCRCKPG